MEQSEEERSSETEELKADLRVATEAAIAAGRSIATSFGSAMEVHYKTPDQPVTDADLSADDILREHLGRARPEYAWLSEETGTAGSRSPSSRTWVVDPLDGTRNFVEGRPEFAVCVGLLEGGTPVLGVIHDPMSGAVYHAIRGWPAFRDGTSINSRRYREGKKVVVVSPGEIRRGTIDPFLGDFDPVLFGSTALKMMKVAEGGADVYVSGTLKGVWDVCAGSVIAESAGAVVRTLAGEPLDFSGSVTRFRGLIVVSAGMTGQIDRVVRLAASATA